MTRILLVRHGESVLGAQGRYAGRLDPPLTSKGRRQILRLRARVRRLSPGRIYSSDLRRCRETAEILASGRPVAYSTALRELSFGAWEGLTYDQVLRRDSSRYRRWLEDPRQAAPPRGERVQHLARRVRAFVARLPRTRRPVLLVTHGGVIRALLSPGLGGFWGHEVPTASLTEWRR